VLHFSESFVGGFFGFRRTYGAAARFEAKGVADLEADWPLALQRVEQWRAFRKERATALHVYVDIPSVFAWDAIRFVVSQLIAPPDELAPPLRGLGLIAAVFGTPDMEQYFDLTLYVEATRSGTPGRKEK
jgi:hypothetical protein